MVRALSPQYVNRDEFLRSVAHVRKVALGTIHWATILPIPNPNEPFEARVERFNRHLVARAVDVTLEGLMDLLDRPNVQFVINTPQGNTEMSESGFINYYRHCEVEWHDKWSCRCNDRCPVCGGEIEPYHSIDDDEDETPLQQGIPEMSEVQDAVAEVEAVTDAAAQHLIDALAAQRAADADGVNNNADLTTQQAYDLGMRGTLVALDNIQAAVAFTQDEKEITIQGGLSALFDGINS